MTNKYPKNIFWIIFLIILVVIIIFIYNMPTLIYRIQCSTSITCSKSAWETVNPACMQIQNPYERASCQQEIAVARHDPVLCVSGMPSDYRISECMKAVIAAAPEDPTVYEKLRNPELRAKFQYEKYDSETEGMVGHSIEVYFLDIVLGEIKFPINISRKHMFICNEIENVYPRDWCYSKIANIENDTSICNKISIESYKDHCYRYIAWNKLDPQICREILDIEIRASCYSEVASMKGDESICEMIEIPKIKETCRDTVADMKIGTKT